MDVNTLVQSAVVTLTAVAWKVAGALVLWLVGRWLIGFAVACWVAAWRGRTSTSR